MKNTRASIHLIAGGRGSNRRKGPDPLLAAVFQLAKVERPKIAYVGTASGDNSVFRLWIAKAFQKAGSGKVSLAPLCGKRADVGKAKQALENSDIVFVSGGDVEEGMRILEERRMIEFLRALYLEGKPFFGVSAGSIMLGRQWVRWKDPEDNGSAELFPCLGFAPLCCDTHGEGDGWEELHALQSLAPARSTSYGITSGASLLVHQDGTLSALGGEVHRFTGRGKSVRQIESLVP